MRMIVSGLIGFLLGALALLGMSVNYLMQLGQSSQAGTPPPELSLTSFAFWSVFFIAGLYYLIRGIRERRRAKNGAK
jgi:hypothetical protein